MADGADDSRLSSLQRTRLAMVCVALTALALKQAPDRVVGDTKLGIALDAWRFLRSGLHLWDPSTDFGVTQNQGYGYLFPMGPLFGLGQSLGVDAWVVQRLWWALLLCLAFTGAEAVARRLGIGTPTTRLLAALAFALSPRLLTTLGPISVESLPYCLAPWVLVPLIDGSLRGSPRRAAARSALVVLGMGAVNAAAVLAALPPAVLWLLTRERGPRRRQLTTWWVVGVLLATAWWVLPLLLLGSYSAPFLDHIESAATTTSITSLVEVLRGTTDWVAYVATAGGPSWPAGHALVTERTAILFTVVVAVAGLAGLLRRDLPERLWLVATALVGITALTFGHVGALSPPWSGLERDLLDGALNPFRNVHKFDVVLRLPLALGIAHLLGVVTTQVLPRQQQTRMQRRAATLGAVAALVGVAVPAVSPGLEPRRPFLEVPGYWHEAAGWLADHGPGRTLVAPGTSEVDYYWGSPNDEPLQVLARTPWTTRSAVPLTPSDTIRALDAVEGQLAVGAGSAGLARALARSGVRYVLVRNDLDYGSTGSTRPLLVHEALVRSPGVRRVASFGGSVGGGVFGRYADQGLEVPYPALEVFEVDGGDERARVVDAASAVRVVGGPEALPALLSQGVLDGQPALLGAGGSAASVVLTDTPRRREVFFGRQQASTSATLTRDEPFRLDAPAHDYLDDGRPVATARYLGAVAVEAGSSASDAAAFGGARPERLPFAAVDGDATTWWSSDPGKQDRASWWRIVLPAARPATGLTLRAPPDVPDRTVQVATDRRRVSVHLAAGQVRAVDLGDDPTRTVTVRATSGTLSLAEVSLPGLSVQRTVDTPRAVRADVVSLATTPVRPSCFPLVGSWLCGRGLATGSEDLGVLDRTVHLGTSASYAPTSLIARPVPGPALDDLLQGTTRVHASTSAVPDPRGDALAAVDGRTGTGWRAAPGDQDPTLTLSWPTEQRLTGIRVVLDPSLAVSRATTARVVAGSERREVELDRNGAATFAPLVASSVEVHLDDPVLTVSVDPYTDDTSLSPVGVSELRLTGAPVPEPASRAVALPCGSGPVLAVGDAVLQTSVRTTTDALADLAAVPLTPCGDAPVRLGDGTRLRMTATPLLAPVSVLLGDPAAMAPAVAAPEVRRWDATRRLLRVPARAAPVLLQVHENANTGWRATLHGRELAPVTLDGWQQGWQLPAGEAGAVELRYVPDRTYRWGLVLGALLVLVLLVGVLWPGAAGPAPVPSAWLGPAWRAVLLVPVVAVGGFLAVAVAAGLWLVRRAVPLGPAAVAVAGGLLWLRPWGSVDYAGRSGLVQALCVAGVCALWGALLPPLRTRSFRRRAGRSSRT